MNKTTEALKLSEKACFAGKECEALLAKLCVKLGMPDLASEFLDPGVFDRAITALREALDHSGEANEMVAEQAEQEPVSWIYEFELPKGYPYDEMFSRSKITEGVRMFPEVQTEQSTVKESLTAQDHIRDATKMVALTTEQAQQIEEALLAYEDISIAQWDSAIATIRAARAQEQAEQEPTNLCQNTTKLVEKDCGGAHHHCYPGSFGD